MTELREEIPSWLLGCRERKWLYWGTEKKKTIVSGTSLASSASTAGDTDSNLGQGTRILHASWSSKGERKENNCFSRDSLQCPPESLGLARIC